MRQKEQHLMTPQQRKKIQDILYNESHKEERKAYFQQWYQEHKEEKKVKSKEYRLDHKDAYQEYQKKYYQENKDEIRSKATEYRQRPEVKTNEYKQNKKHQQAIKLQAHQIVAELHGKPIACFNCKSTKNLDIDHILEDGKNERKSIDTRKLRLSILEWSELGFHNFIMQKYQLLCHRCNVKKYYQKQFFKA